MYIYIYIFKKYFNVLINLCYMYDISILKLLKRKFKNILLSLTQEDINKITSYKTLNIL